MKLLMVAPEFPPEIGGMEIHSGKTAEILAHLGHRLVVFTRRLPGAPAGSPGYRLERVLTRDFRANLRVLLGGIREFRPDAVLLMNAGFAPLAAADGPLPPILVRTAGNDAYAAWHGPRLPLRFLAWRLPHRRPGSLGQRLRRLDQERRTGAVLAGLGRCARILCNSSYSRARLAQLGVPEARLRVVAGGVDTVHFSPSATASGPKAEPVIGIAGHLLPIKGIDVALHAVAAMRPSPRLRIAGAGEEEASLRQLAGRLGIAARVDFAGEIPYERMPDFYRGLEVYVQPSREIRHPASGWVQAESMGRALCEAQACGAAVVASRSGGIPDVVLEGRTGLLVPPEDPAALGAAIAQLLASPERRAAFGREARALATARLSWEAVVEQTLAQVEEAARVPASPPRGSGSSQMV